MALADFFHRDAVAISQILQGFETDVFIEQLEGVRVAIAFGEQAATSRDGRDLVELSVRLAARLYPSLTIVTDPAADRYAEEMKILASSINPNIDFSVPGTHDVALAIGENAPALDAPTIYTGCEGWLGRIGINGPFTISDQGNPFGAGFAACLGAANLFRFLFLPEGKHLLDEDIGFPTDADMFPSLTAATLTEPLVLVGAGAVGNSAAWALARTPFKGEIWLIDPETIELSNLQRYILCGRSDEDGVKVEIASREFEGGLQPIPFHGPWASFLERYGFQWDRVLVALDSSQDRRAVQASLPRWIANAWTQIGDLGVSSHAFLGPDACLACLYLPTQVAASEDEVIAAGLKIPQMQSQVRILLGSGQGTDRKICEAIATAWGIPASKLEPYVNRPIRDLWVEGVCGGAIIPLGESGVTPRELQVPLAFQSALAGVLLASEAARDLLTAGSQRRTVVRRADLLRPLGDSSPQSALKDGTGRCICEDPDFVAAYRDKHALESPLASAAAPA